MLNNDEINCPKCCVKLRRSNYETHMEKVHSPEANRIRRLQERQRKDIKADGQRYVKCPVCETEIKKCNLNKHKRKIHHISLSSSRTVKTGITLGMTGKQKERCLNKFFGPDREYSADVMNRCKVVSGGAYGLGRSRRH